jgi:hypothetical protein
MMDASVEGSVTEINKLLEQLPGAVQAAAFKKGLRPAANAVRKRVKELTPRSSQTGSTKKWDAQTKAKRAGELPLWKTAKVKLWQKGGKAGIALVGYEWPRGNKGHFVIESKNKTSKQVYWGNLTAVTPRRKVDVLKRSLDETKSQANAAFVGGIRKEVEKQVEMIAIRRRLDG